ncbi:hypothetical protein LguiA_036737 [Lonicera macranthoides]
MHLHCCAALIPCCHIASLKKYWYFKLYALTMLLIIDIQPQTVCEPKAAQARRGNLVRLETKAKSNLDPSNSKIDQSHARFSGYTPLALDSRRVAALWRFKDFQPKGIRPYLFSIPHWLARLSEIQTRRLTRSDSPPIMPLHCNTELLLHQTRVDNTEGSYGKASHAAGLPPSPVLP